MQGSTRSDIARVRAELLAQTGELPTLAQVGAILGVTRERVRQLYAALDIEPASANRERKSSERQARQTTEKQAMIAERLSARQTLTAEIQVLLKSGLTQTEVADALGISQSFVSKLMVEAGVRKRRMFTAADDAAIMSAAYGGMQAIADAQGRTVAACRARKLVLRRKMR